MVDVSMWQTALISLGSALVGGSFVHFLAGRRDIDSKRRDLVVKHKMELWKLIDQQNGLAAKSLGIDVPDLTPWEQIVREIQLLGTNEQILWVHEIVNGVNTGNQVSFNPLLDSLKKELRNELGLQDSSHPYFWFRVKNVRELESGAKQ
jgi:hypothetical protein